MKIKQKYKALNTHFDEVLTFDPMWTKFGDTILFTMKVKSDTGYRTTIEMSAEEAKKLHKFLDDTIKEDL